MKATLHAVVFSLAVLQVVGCAILLGLAGCTLDSGWLPLLAATELGVLATVQVIGWFFPPRPRWVLSAGGDIANDPPVAAQPYWLCHDARRRACIARGRLQTPS
ncbi:hypothetical protein [Chitiniphilus eburneus]|uniref:Lipoprotein n=1 Tax=Chitiniphilus eburneus TaxID=2571148 RepID=A0A4U0Q7U1_9NEIS|nr:hypothetical protein [Chitiniphilus eburneus]TJZ77307.1 hypothetical protein FAZ21_02885 [Chitiniphilus eburneus]